MPSVWLALQGYSFQGYNLLGIYTSCAAAEAALAGVREQDREIREIPLDTTIDEWLGN